MQFEENLYANEVYKNKNVSSYFCDYHSVALLTIIKKLH